MNFKEKLSPSAQKKLSDLLFILYAGGAALLSYSLVYALRKPFTAATFDGMELFGMDYKIATSIIQIFGYMVSKFIGIKLISELKREGRLKFILVSILVAELSLVLFGCLPRPFNVLALFFNGLSLGCMWGVIFSFLEGRRVTDLLASLFGLSIAVSSGTAKSIGLFVVDTLHVSEFWMPALIGAVAGVALVGGAVFAVHEKGVHSDFAGGQAQPAKDFRQGVVVSDGRLPRQGALHRAPPVCRSTQRQNFSLGTTMRLPMRRAGKPSSCISS